MTRQEQADWLRDIGFPDTAILIGGPIVTMVPNNGVFKS